jgi:hypothetical protein
MRVRELKRWRSGENSLGGGFSVAACVRAAAHYASAADRRSGACDAVLRFCALLFRGCPILPWFREGWASGPSHPATPEAGPNVPARLAARPASAGRSGAARSIPPSWRR